MHINECNWIYQNLRNYKINEISPIIDLGGSTEKYRTIDQPWLENDFYQKLRNKGVNILFSDIKKEVGVDLVGDIFNNKFVLSLKRSNFNCIFCCNFLEHVLDPKDLIDRCMSILPIGGILVITVPYSYPYHRDPIDTLYRPDIGELSKLVDSHEIISSEIISTGSYRDHIAKSPWKIFRHIRVFFPFLGFEKWKRSAIKLKWLFTNFKHTCMIVKKSHSNNDIII